MRSAVFALGLAIALPALAFVPYSYCSKDTCSAVYAPQRLFFGTLPESVKCACNEASMYALTFDDGPTEKWDQLLPLLDLYGAKATFFVNGRNINTPAQEARLRKAHQAGHAVSNHSQNHRNLLELDAAAIALELEATRARIVQVLGNDATVEHNARIVRAPFGYSDQRVVHAVQSSGFRLVRWNSDRWDWELGGEDSTTYLSRFSKHLAFLDANADKSLNRSIMDLNHDRAKATLDSLPTLIAAVKDRGYRFVTVATCIDE